MSVSTREEIGHRVLSRRALKALAELGELNGGPLSPLARVSAPAGSADRDGLIAALERMDGAWESLMPALLDPGLSLGVIVVDRDDQRLGQYLWIDPAGLGPGFQVSIAPEEIVLQGPLSLEDVELSLLDALALGGVAEIPPERYTLSADQFWVLLAIIDALGTAAALRQAARVSGPPPGLTIADVLDSWKAGLTQSNPGWAVSLLRLLSPEQVPADFHARLDRVLSELEAAGLLSRLAGKTGTDGDQMILLREGLQLLCRGLSAGGIGFGFVRSELVASNQVEVTTVAGWRTAGGFVLADVSALAENRVSLLLIGPAYLAQLIGDLLGTRAAAQADTPRDVELGTADLIERLRGARPAGTRRKKSTKAGGCPACGAPTRPGARFCGQCGKPLS